VDHHAAALELLAELDELVFGEVMLFGDRGELRLLDLTAVLRAIDEGTEYVSGVGVQRSSFLCERGAASRRRRSNLSIRPPESARRSRPV